jgi:hypothetical protein
MHIGRHPTRDFSSIAAAAASQSSLVGNSMYLTATAELMLTIKISVQITNSSEFHVKMFMYSKNHGCCLGNT